MQVSKVIKTSEGTVKFEGELSHEEHEFVIMVGLHSLMEQGALPFVYADEEGNEHIAASFVPASEEIQ